MLDDYTVYRIKATGEEVTAYREDLQTLLDEQGLTLEDVDLIPFSELPAGTIAELIGSEAENANYHEFTSLAEGFYKGLKGEGFSDEEQARILRVLARSMMSLF